MAVSSNAKDLDDRTSDASVARDSHSTRRSDPPEARGRPAGSTLAGEADEHAERAVAQSTRLEANLGFLLRGLGDLRAGASAARDASVALARELSALRVLLERSREEEAALRSRVRLLERALDAATRRAAEERSFVARQEEAFLSELLTTHEQELTALRERIGVGAPTQSTLPPPPDDTPTPIGAVELRTFRIPRPGLPGERAPAPRSSRSEPSLRAADAPRSSRSEPSLRAATTYSLGSGEVAVERIDAAPAGPPRDPR
jgi:hypothetical protein